MPTNGDSIANFAWAWSAAARAPSSAASTATAAVLDNRAALVAGALSSRPGQGQGLRPRLRHPAERAYGSYQEMIAAEAKLPADKRIDFVSVATPNHTHFEIAKAFAEAGFNVMCDKPMTFDLAQAEELAKVVEKTGVVFAVTHNYTGYPLVRQAREMILAGELGEINAVRAFYIQGWLRTRLEARKPEAGRLAHRSEATAAPPAASATSARTPTTSAAIITGLMPRDRSLPPEESSKPGRALDDYGTAVIRFENGALGTVTASQISHGRENDLWIEVDGTKGSLEWHQEEPNKMLVRRNGQPHAIYTRDPERAVS